jgi:hypothetical protein
VCSSRLAQDAVPGVLQVERADLRQTPQQGFLDPHLDPVEIALGLRQFVERLRGDFHLLVFDQAADQFGARIIGLFAGHQRRLRQQHARLDLDQHRGHHQVVGGEFEVLRAHRVDIDQILLGQRRHRDVEDIRRWPCGSGTAGGRAVLRKRRA